MVKKLLLKVLTFWALLLTSALGWGQCNEKPTASISGGTTICYGESVNLSITGTANAVVTYTKNGSSSTQITLSSSGQALLTIPELFSTTTFKLTQAQIGSCSPQTLNSSVTVTVNPLPIVDAGIVQTVCSGGTITLAGSVTGGATTGTWSAPSGSFSNVNSLNSTYTPSLNSGTVTLTLTSADPSGPCSSVTDSVVITVNPATIVDAGAIQTVCAGGTITLAGKVTGGATTGTWSASSGNFSSASSLTSTYTPTIESGTVILTLTSSDSDGTGPCVPVEDTVEIKVNPATVVDAGAVQTVCAGGTITLAGSVTGGATSGTWSAPTGEGTFSNAGTLNSTFTPSIASGKITLTLTSADSDGTGPCSTVEDTVEITVNPATIVDAGAVQTVCAGGTITLAGSVTGGATSGTWSAPTGEGTFSNAGTLNSTFTPSIASGKVTLTLTSADSDGTGPCSTVEDTVEITVNPATIVDAGAVQTVCAGGTITLAGSITGGTTTGTWSAPSGSFSNINSLTSTYTPSISSGIVILTLTSADSDGTGPCSTVQDTVEITVNPATVVDAGSTQTVCAGGTITLAGSITGGATMGTWTAPSGNFSSAGSLTSSYTPTIESGTVTLTLTSADSDGTGPCSTVQDTVEITVNPATVVDAGSTQTVCAGDKITLEGSITGGTTTGTWSAPSGSFSNINSLTSTYTPSIASGTVILTLTSVDSDGAGPCTSVEDTVEISVVEKIQITTQPLPEDVCSANRAEFTIEATGAELSYQWYKTSDPGMEGTAVSGASSKTYSIVSTEAGDAGWYYVLVSGASVCEPVKSDVVSLDVDENVIVQKHPVKQDLCIADNLTLTIEATADGGDPVFKWRKNGVELEDDGRITGSKTGTLQISGLTSADAGDYDVIIDGPDGFTCDVGYSEVATVIVFDPPTVNAGADFSVCSTAGEISLGSDATAENYSNLEWSIVTGSGILENNADIAAKYIPGADETGEIILQLKANGNGSCVAVTDQVAITIIPLPVINTFTYPADLCTSIEEAQSPTVLGQNDFSGGSFSYEFNGEGSGTLILDTSTGKITPNGSTVGSYTIKYTAPDDGYCAPVTKTVDISIEPLPIAEFSYTATPYCSNSTNPLPVFATGGTAGVFSAGEGLVFVDSSTGEVDLASSTPGAYTVTNTIAAANRCREVVATAEMVITKLPIAEFSYEGSPYCSDGENPVITLADGAEIGTFTSNSTALVFANTSTGEINIAASTPGDYIVTNTIEAADGCAVVTSTANITISELPIATFKYEGSPFCSDASNPTVIIEGEAVKGTFSSTEGLFFKDSSSFLNSTTGEIDIAASTPGTYIITNTVDYVGADEDGCGVVTDTFEIVINEKPVADFKYLTNQYCSDESNPVAQFEGAAVPGVFTEKEGKTGLKFLDTATGAIDLTGSAPGNYTIVNTVDYDADGCGAVSAEFSLTITERLDPTFAYESTAFCVTEGSATVSEGFITGGEFTSSTLGSKIDTNSGTISWSPDDTSIIGSHTISYLLPTDGGCNYEPFTVTIKIDPVPVGGELNFTGLDNIISLCTNPSPSSGYETDLNLTGSLNGVITGWWYRESSDSGWTLIEGSGSPFTGSTLPAELIKTLSINETTRFRVNIANDGCSIGVFSEEATLGIISSDIVPNPVTVTPGVVCVNEPVRLTASTGYGSGSDIEGGGFDTANSLTSEHGWRVRRNGSKTDLDFPAAGNNTRPNLWSNTNDQPFYTANLTGTGGKEIRWDSGDKKFAIVAGNNPSTLETPVFNTFAMESATLTFNQAYNLTAGASVNVKISTDGGENYEEILFSIPSEGFTVPGKSTTFNPFNSGDSSNVISLDLSDYLNQPNLRIQFEFVGTKDGDIWAIDNIKIPEGPSGVEMEWKDYTDPTNPVVIVDTENFIPQLIGWNDVQVITRLTFDSTGADCPVVENSENARVFVFDRYTSTAETAAGPCGATSAVIMANVINSKLEDVTGIKTRDEYAGHWEVISGPTGYSAQSSHFSNDDDSIAAVNDPNAVFTPGVFGEFTLRWVLSTSAVDGEGKALTNTNCPPTYSDAKVIIKDCLALDFDGVDDYVDLGEGYTGDYSIEAWILPFPRKKADDSETDPKLGTVISTPQLEINMTDLIAAGVTTDNRWYHIAVDSDDNLYIDGISTGTKIPAPSEERKKSTRSFIGARWNEPNTENHFSGYIEEVRIWNGKIEQDQIRFLMNQRLENDGTIGVEIPMAAPGLPYSNLAGYYQLLATAILPGGYTQDLATSFVNGKLRNMETWQENTAPLPYTTAKDNYLWTDEGEAGPWTNWDVWDIPNAKGIKDTPITWNIVKTSNYVESGKKDIIVLGLIVELNELDILNTDDVHDENNSGQSFEVTHYLKIDGLLDLTGESQLLQPEGSIVDAASKGALERDQQGTASSYNYNYWSSPVSPGANNANYSVGEVIFDGTSQTPQNISFGTAYAHADGDFTTPRRISEYWLHSFKGTANEYAVWHPIGSTEKIKVGEGYSMKGTSGKAAIKDPQNYTFKGIPNNGDVNLSIGTGQNYLIGNPYPSAIDAKAFIEDNLILGGSSTNIFNGTLYFWHHFSGHTHYLQEYIGGYAMFNLSGSVVAISNDERVNANDDEGDKKPGRYIPVGQGFFINTMGVDTLSTSSISGGNFKLKNEYRVYKRENEGSSSIFHSQEKKGAATATTNNNSSAEVEQNKIWLKFKSPKGYHRQILVTADQRTTENFDLGFDAPMIDQNVEDMYWYFSNYQFVIQGVPDFNIERVLDLGINVEQKGSLSISIDDLDNIPDEMNIYLADSLHQVVHDLRAEPYETESEAGTFTDRFKLVFQDKTQIEEPEIPVIEEGPFEVLYVTGTRNVLLRNPELLEVDRVYLNNMLGQQIHVYYNVPTEKEVELPVKRFSAGVYIVKVHYEGGILTRKVILE